MPPHAPESAKRRLSKGVTEMDPFQMALNETFIPLQVQNGLFSTQQVFPKRQHLHIIRIGSYELTERFVRLVDEVIKRDGVSIPQGAS